MNDFRKYFEKGGMQLVNNNKILVPESRKELDKLKANVNNSNPDHAKFEIADELGIPFSKDDNGEMTAKDAGKIGGSIGGHMVKEMVRLAQEQMLKK